jgi:hypothetical protein
MNLNTLFMMQGYIPSVLKLEPVMLDGIPSYIVLIPPLVKNWMFNPNNSGSFGAYLQNIMAYKDVSRDKIPGECGRFGNMVFVEDYRAPTLTIGGSTGSYTLKVGLMRPGNNDDRNLSAWSNTSGSTNYVHDMVIVLGANAIAEYLVDPMQTGLKAETEYGQIQGRGLYLGEGIQLPYWDKDTAGMVDGALGTRTLIYKGSAVMPIGRTPWVGSVS